MILHIPHASTRMIDGIIVKDFKENINLLTDWYADELFSYNGSPKVIAEFSRLVTDVERFVNDPMEKFGKGYIYSTNINDRPIIREIRVMERCKGIYNAHHLVFSTVVSGYIPYFPVAMIVDCHTFNNDPLPWEEKSERPDFCIGFNEGSGVDTLVTIIKSILNKEGYSVGINTPYSGAIVPKGFEDNKNICSIMIEVNKRLYLNTNTFKKMNPHFKGTKDIISKVLGLINEWEKNWEIAFWKQL